MLKALRSDGTPATPEDAERLRDALVTALEQRAQESAGRSKKQLLELTRRLARFPTPTGLGRRLEKLLAQAPPVDPGTPPPGWDELPSVISEAADALLLLALRVALPEEELEESLTALRDRLTPRMGLGDTRRLAREAAALIEASTPIRARFMACRAACVDLLQAVSEQLAEGQAATDRMATRSASLVELVSRNESPEALAALKAELIDGLTALKTDAGKAQGSLAACEDRIATLELELDDAHDALSAAREAATLDPLTGALNRRGYNPLLRGAIANAHRAGQPLCLLTVDLDHFKLLNDRYGHPAGDMVLKVTTETFLCCLRPEDLVARVGGEEFAVLLPDTDTAAAEAIANRLRETLARKIFVSGRQRFSATASIGLATLRRDDTAASLTARSDEALYSAKESGRNCCKAA